MADLKDKVRNTISVRTHIANHSHQIFIATGASSGIGLATCEALLKHGARILGVDINPAPESLKSFDAAKWSFHQCNICDVSAPNDIVAACKEAFSSDRIDGLLNIAGIMDNFNSADTLDDRDWERVMAIDLTAPVYLMRAVLPFMQKQKSGTIVNVSSKAGTSGAAAGIAYTAAKHGLVGATKQTAWRYRWEGIRCNAICPGPVATKVSDSMVKERTDVASLQQLTPVQNLILGQHYEGLQQPDAAAEMVVFLASDASRNVNGESCFPWCAAVVHADVDKGAIIPVDGGWSTL